MARPRTIATAVALALGWALALASGVGALSPAARAAEIPPDADAKTLKNAQERFAREYDTADIDYKLRALRTFAAVQHPKVAKDLLKLLREEDRHVRAEVVLGLGRQLSSARLVGTRLLKLVDELRQDEEQAKVVQACVESLGALEYTKAEEELRQLIHHADDGVVAAVFGVYGRWKSDVALREMLDFFTRYPDEKSFATGTVTVDTGAEGNKDANAAKAKWKSKYGGQQNWRPRPECTKALVAALKQITGHGFRRPEDLAEYLADADDYVDPETVGERVDEETRRAIFAAWCRIREEAASRAKKEVPDDEASEERGKLYRRHLGKMRDDLLEKHRLRLSELDVIVEQGEAAGWPAQ